MPRLKTLATRARDVGNTLHGLAGNKAGEQSIPQVASGFDLVLFSHGLKTCLSTVPDMVMAGNAG